MISDELKDKQLIQDYRTGKLTKGLTTGYSQLDNHFVWKNNHFTIINGHDNIGKTAFWLYLLVVSAKLHGHKYIIYTSENMVGFMKMEIVQYVSKMDGKSMANDVFAKHYKWMSAHFTFVDNEKVYKPSELLDTFSSLYDGHTACVADPYNSLKNEKNGLGGYDYSLDVASQFVQFKKQICSLHVITHTTTDAKRQYYRQGERGEEFEGFPKPPEKGDINGGGVWSDRCDDFLTIHRMIEHPDRWRITEVYVRKVKYRQLGGCPTIRYRPVEFIMKDPHTFVPNSGLAYDPLSQEKETQTLDIKF